MRIDYNNLPVFAVYDDVPYLIYDDDKRGPIAINSSAQESGLLPEILFEGEQITPDKFKELANGTGKYQEVLDFYKSIQKAA